MSRRAATLLVLLAACAQPPIALPPPLPEDCGLTTEDREALERWEREKFEPIRELDALRTIPLDADAMPQASEQHCSIHGDALEVLPAIAVPGLAGSTSGGIIRVFDLDSYQTEGTATIRECFDHSLWETFFGPEDVEFARLTVPVGCYFRTPVVLAYACSACRSEHRRWCREYLKRRERHLHDYPARYEAWHRGYKEMLSELERAWATGQD